MSNNQVFVGFARKPIKVPVGTPMGGYQARSKPSTGVHDTLFVNCIAISRQPFTALPRTEISSNSEIKHNTICLCSIDVVGIEKHRTLKVKEEINQKYNIPVENILVSAIHTHSGPLTIELFAPPWKDFEIIYDLLKVTIEEALQDMKPSVLKVAKGNIPGVSFNRRTYDKLSDVVNDEVVILKILDLVNPKVVRGIIYNFSNHPVVMGAENLEISQDWPYFTHLKLNKYLSDINQQLNTEQTEKESKISLSPFIVFFQGTPGNLNPINTPMDKATHHTFEDCKFIGDKTADAIIKILENESSFITLDINEESIKCSMKEVKLSIEDEDKAEIFTFADVIEKEDGFSEEHEFFVSTFCHVIRLGDLTIVGLPGEVFSHLGLEIKEMSKRYFNSEYTMVVGYANDYIGYFGPKEIYLAGGYEMLMMSLSENEGPEILEAVEQIMKNI